MQKYSIYAESAVANHTNSSQTHTQNLSLLQRQLFPATAEGESNYIKTWQQ